MRVSPGQLEMCPVAVFWHVLHLFIFFTFKFKDMLAGVQILCSSAV